MYDPWKLMSLYFDDGEYSCFGDQYCRKVESLDKILTARNPAFFSINPLDGSFDHAFFMKEHYDYYTPRRADLNVIKFRNFMFEMDSTPLDVQMEVLTGCGIPWTGIVYSGGKSYHAILSLENGLKVDCHTLDGISEYKKIWDRLRAKIEFSAGGMGYDVKVDVSSKNPSRLSRFPGSVRDNGNVQSVVYIGTRISEENFNSLLDVCPKIAGFEPEEFNAPEQQIESIDVFLDICPNSLKRKLLYVDWGSDAGMYPFIYRYTAWAIDSTNIAYHTFIEFLRDNTFMQLVNNFGYPVSKLRNLEECVYNVYKRKFRL